MTKILISDSDRVIEKRASRLYCKYLEAQSTPRKLKKELERGVPFYFFRDRLVEILRTDPSRYPEPHKENRYFLADKISQISSYKDFVEIMKKYWNLPIAHDDNYEEKRGEIYGGEFDLTLRFYLPFFRWEIAKMWAISQGIPSEFIEKAEKELRWEKALSLADELFAEFEKLYFSLIPDEYEEEEEFFEYEDSPLLYMIDKHLSKFREIELPEQISPEFILYYATNPNNEWRWGHEDLRRDSGREYVARAILYGDTPDWDVQEYIVKERKRVAEYRRRLEERQRYEASLITEDLSFQKDNVEVLLSLYKVEPQQKEKLVEYAKRILNNPASIKLEPEAEEILFKEPPHTITIKLEVSGGALMSIDAYVYFDGHHRLNDYLFARGWVAGNSGSYKAQKDFTYLNNPQGGDREFNAIRLKGYVDKFSVVYAKLPNFRTKSGVYYIDKENYVVNPGIVGYKKISGDEI